VNFYKDGQLVKVGDVDGIVFHVASVMKIEVAVPDKEHGAVFQTVSPGQLEPRTSPGEHDQALRKLIRSTPSPRRGGPGGGSVGARSGHTRGTPHRASGRGG
jgi:hypothetical protein